MKIGWYEIGSKVNKGKIKKDDSDFKICTAISWQIGPLQYAWLVCKASPLAVDFIVRRIALQLWQVGSRSCVSRFLRPSRVLRSPSVLSRWVRKNNIPPYGPIVSIYLPGRATKAQYRCLFSSQQEETAQWHSLGWLFIVFEQCQCSKEKKKHNIWPTSLSF